MSVIPITFQRGIVNSALTANRWLSIVTNFLLILCIFGIGRAPSNLPRAKPEKLHHEKPLDFLQNMWYKPSAYVRPTNVQIHNESEVR
jgi:hypothetical protein